MPILKEFVLPPDFQSFTAGQAQTHNVFSLQIILTSTELIPNCFTLSASSTTSDMIS